MGQALGILAAEKINCPVLILHGAADYESCSIVEPQLITRTVNEAHPGNAIMQIIPELDHFMMKSKNWEEARDNFNTNNTQREILIMQSQKQQLTG